MFPEYWGHECDVITHHLTRKIEGLYCWRGETPNIYVHIIFGAVHSFMHSLPIFSRSVVALRRPRENARIVDFALNLSFLALVIGTTIFVWADLRRATAIYLTVCLQDCVHDFHGSEPRGEHAPPLEYVSEPCSDNFEKLGGWLNIVVVGCRKQLFNSLQSDLHWFDSWAGKFELGCIVWSYRPTLCNIQESPTTYNFQQSSLRRSGPFQSWYPIRLGVRARRKQTIMLHRLYYFKFVPTCHRFCTIVLTTPIQDHPWNRTKVLLHPRKRVSFLHGKPRIPAIIKKNKPLLRIVQKCLSPNPVRRPTAAALCNSLLRLCKLSTIRGAVCDVGMSWLTYEIADNRKITECGGFADISTHKRLTLVWSLLGMFR